MDSFYSGDLEWEIKEQMEPKSLFAKQFSKFRQILEEKTDYKFGVTYLILIKALREAGFDKISSKDKFQKISVFKKQFLSEEPFGNEINSVIIEAIKASFDTVSSNAEDRRITLFMQHLYESPYEFNDKINSIVRKALEKANFDIVSSKDSDHKIAIFTQELEKSPYEFDQIYPIFYQALEKVGFLENKKKLKK